MPGVPQRRRDPYAPVFLRLTVPPDPRASPARAIHSTARARSPAGPIVATEEEPTTCRFSILLPLAMGRRARVHVDGSTQSGLRFQDRAVQLIAAILATSAAPWCTRSICMPNSPDALRFTLRHREHDRRERLRDAVEDEQHPWCGTVVADPRRHAKAEGRRVVPAPARHSGPWRSRSGHATSNSSGPYESDRALTSPAST